MVRTQHFHIQSRVGELRSHKLRSVAKKKPPKPGKYLLRDSPGRETMRKRTGGVNLPGVCISRLEGGEISLQQFAEGFCHWVCPFQ